MIVNVFMIHGVPRLAKATAFCYGLACTMRWLWITLIIALIVFGGGYFLLKTSTPANNYTVVPSSNLQHTMTISSSAFEEGGNIPSDYTCDGEDKNPPLKIADVPEDAQTLALIMHDPDAPKDGGWTHWTLWNIHPEADTVDENSVPEDAVEGVTDFGSVGYGGPCPPSGTHRYNFILYALDTELNLDPETTKEELEHAIEGHILAQAKLMGTYSRE